MTLPIAFGPMAIALAAQAELPPATPPAELGPVVVAEPAEPPAVDNEIIEGRRRPDYTEPLPEEVTQTNVGAVRAPPPEAFPVDQVPVPDRWRLIESLGVVKERWWDPYNQNTYKGDRPINPDKVPWLPITGDDWFFIVNAVRHTEVGRPWHINQVPRRHRQAGTQTRPFGSHRILGDLNGELLTLADFAANIRVLTALLLKGDNI